MHTDRCGNTRRQKCCSKGNGKERKIQQFRYRDTTNVEPEMYDIPVITGATGIVTRSLRKHSEAVPGKHSIDTQQKTAILGTSHLLTYLLHGAEPLLKS